MEKECFDAFCYGKKEEALKLLPKLSNPGTVRDSRYISQPLYELYCRNWTLLHYAAWNDQEDVCKLLVEKYNCDPTDVDDDSRSPLHVACEYRCETSVKYLVTLPSVLRRINDKDYYRTPLHWACLRSHISVIETLLETNAVKINEEDRDGCTPVEAFGLHAFYRLNIFAPKIDWNTQLPVKSFFGVFLVGNSGAGKSTLAAAMLELTQYEPTQHGRISNVEKLTAGIVPTQCTG